MSDLPPGHLVSPEAAKSKYLEFWRFRIGAFLVPRSDYAPHMTPRCDPVQLAAALQSHCLSPYFKAVEFSLEPKNGSCP